jgi:hypothetical protein
MTGYPSYTLDVAHEPDSRDVVWTVTLSRQEKRYARRVQLGRGQGRTLAIALSAVAHLARTEERTYPELA